MTGTKSAPLVSIAGPTGVSKTPPIIPLPERIACDLEQLPAGRGRPKAPDVILAALVARANRGFGHTEKSIGQIAALVTGRSRPYTPKELERAERSLTDAEAHGLQCPPSTAPMDAGTARRVQAARAALLDAWSELIAWKDGRHAELVPRLGTKQQASWRLWQESAERMAKVAELEAQLAAALGTPKWAKPRHPLKPQIPGIPDPTFDAVVRGDHPPRWWGPWWVEAWRTQSRTRRQPWHVRVAKPRRGPTLPRSYHIELESAEGPWEVEVLCEGLLTRTVPTKALPETVMRPIDHPRCPYNEPDGGIVICFKSRDDNSTTKADPEPLWKAA